MLLIPSKINQKAFTLDYLLRDCKRDIVDVNFMAVQD